MGAGHLNPCLQACVASASCPIPIVVMSISLELPHFDSVREAVSDSMCPASLTVIKLFGITLT